MKKKSIFKKWDIIIILVLILISFIPQIIFGVVKGNEYNRTYAVISINGDVYKKISLSEHFGQDEFRIESEYGINKISIKENQIIVLEASCADSVCMKQGYISKPGESIVCLPNKLIIEIKGDKVSSEEDIILSH
ncbi:MAG: NusG domain II-containing protein [Sarcina sp.]